MKTIYINLFLIILTATTIWFVKEISYDAGYEAGVNSVHPEVVTKMIEIPVEKTVPVYKKVFVPGKTANIDSIWAAALEYWKKKMPARDPNIEVDADTETPGSFLFTAIKDTTYEDSLLYAYVSYNSFLPLDPNGYFETRYLIKKETAILPAKKSFWKDRFSLNLSLGQGYNFNSKDFGGYIGLGIGINLINFP